MNDDIYEMKSLNPGAIIRNRYLIKNLLAKGGMASTYLAEDKKSGKTVVLKVLFLSQLENWKTYELFKREIVTLKNLDHPQIPEYIDHFDLKLHDDTCFILVQEYAGGSNLFDLVKNGKKFTHPEIRKLLIDLLKILSHIHQLNPSVIHRDINPKNIIIDDKGTVYLVDFSASGSIKKTTIAAARSDTFVGTIGYIPPEQFYGKVMPQSDLYALGVTMIYLLTGKEPSEFELKSLKLDYKPYTSLPGDLEILLDMMIDPDSAKRPDSADQALVILNMQYEKKADQGRDVEFTEIPPPPRRVPFFTRAVIKFNEGPEIIGMILFLLFIVPVIFIPGIHTRRIIPALRMVFAGSTAKGVITNYVRSGDSTPDGTSILKYYFRFKAEDNREYVQFSFVKGNKYETNQRVIIKYVRSNPLFSVIQGERYSPFSLDSTTTIAVIILIILFPLPFLRYVVWNKPGAYKYIRLLKKGNFIYGKMIKTKHGFAKDIVYYQYLDSKNRIRKGKQKIEDLDFISPDKIVPLIYLNGLIRTYSRIIDKPLTYRKGVRFLHHGERVFNDRAALLFAVLRPLLLAGFFVLTIIDTILSV